jgi:hypothetical protein
MLGPLVECRQRCDNSTRAGRRPRRYHLLPLVFSSIMPVERVTAISRTVQSPQLVADRGLQRPLQKDPNKFGTPRLKGLGVRNLLREMGRSHLLNPRTRTSSGLHWEVCEL